MKKLLRSWLWHVPVDREVQEELAHHTELRARELAEQGMEPAAARAEAERRLGDRAALAKRLQHLGEERDRARRRAQWLSDLRLDLGVAIRHARRNPGFTAGVVLTLALGLGATTSIFSVVHAVVLAPFPYAAPERVLSVYTTWKGSNGGTSAGNFDYLRQRVTTIAPLSAAAFSSFNLAGDDQPERILGLRATASWFDVFEIPPLIGRTFTATEDQPGHEHVAVLSHGLWKRRFGGRADAIGATLRLNNEPYTVIGVMPPAFASITDEASVILPIAFTPERLAMYDEHYLEMYGRRRPDVSQAQVNDELARVAADLRRDHPEQNVDRSATSERLDEAIVGDFRLRLVVLLLAVSMVLVIACGNAAHLLLARLAARSRELSIRAALGAGRGRIVRQVLAESLVLALLGGIAGVVAAWWALPALIAAAPDGVPRLADASLNGRVLFVAVLLAIASAVIVGVLPSWSATNRNLRQDLGDGKGTVSGTLVPWLRQALIAAQAAIVVIVLAGAALLIRSAINLQEVPLGFDTTGVLRARVGLQGDRFRSSEAVKNAFASLEARLSASPGVSVSALDSQAPLVGSNGSNGLIPEGRPIDMASIINSRSHFVTPGYFRLLRQPLRAGREFAAADLRSAPLVMIINETLARQAFGTLDPIGRRISCCEGKPGEPSWKIVVGVVGDVRSRGPAQDPLPEFYLPLAQIPEVAWSWINNTLDVMVRAAEGDPIALAGTIRSAVAELDPTLPVYAIRTMDEGLRRSTAQARFNTVLMTLLALTGLILAALGIYSLIAWLVAQRTREIGVRMALGAAPSRVVRQVVAHGLRPFVVGLLSGVAAAMATGRLLQGQLFMVGPRDPATLMVVVAVLLVVAALAALVPARRATRIDPAQALHEA
ncbi:MAG TPA: ABC transporter permease [Vicinamibacterales bacterium]|nr:ABC transporter permease [Vicinamibacterales bacterium]